MRCAIDGFWSNQEPTTKIVSLAPPASAADSNARPSAGSPEAWKVSATSCRVRGPLTTSVAGPVGTGDREGCAEEGGTVDRRVAGEGAAVPDLAAALQAAATPAPAAASVPIRRERRDSGNTRPGYGCGMYGR